MTSFKVEALLTNLKDLQTEKICLEQKLNKCRERRRQHEQELERASNRLFQVADVHRKMAETLKVAQLKVTQTQVQMESLETSNQNKKDRITSINKNIEEEKKQQQKNVHDFEDLLSDLTEKLYKARTFYKEDNLQSELIENKKKIENFNNNLLDKERQMDELASELTRVNLADSTEEPEIPTGTCQVVWDMVKEENKTIHSYLEHLQKGLKDLHDSQPGQDNV